MKITQEKKDDLNALLKINLSSEDYQQKVNDVIKNYCKTANVPGFRKGKVPAGQIKKMYGKSILVEEVNKLLQDSIYKYITENKIEVLGNPLPLENNIDWENSVDFEFKFEMGLAPDFKVDLDKKVSFNFYKIKADKKMIDHYSNDVAKRYGSMIHPEISEENDLILGDFVQLDNKKNILEGGISHTASVALDVVMDKKSKKSLVGVSKGSEVIIRINKNFSKDVSHMLNINKEQADLLDSNFKFTVKNISRMNPSDLNQDLFDKVFGTGTVNNKKEFRSKIQDEIEKSFIVESDRKLKNDIVLHLINKLNLKLPDEFLKKWLLQTNDKNLTLEQIEAEYTQYSKSLRWQLIENKIIKENNLEVTNEDVLNHTKDLIKQNFGQYGQKAPEENKLTEIAGKVLENEDERKKVYNQLYDFKTLSLYKRKFKLNDKSVTYDEFVKLASK
tara:strand:- start:790 stop:2127 length:1338 start_codon:yes stop_codon:yes gene_type:complete